MLPVSPPSPSSPLWSDVWHAGPVELDDLLNAMDRAAANLAKLEDVWRRAQSFMPSGPSRGSHPEYDDLRCEWSDLLVGLPKIDGWTITEDLPDIDEIGQIFIDYFDISEHPGGAYEATEQPGKDVADYRYRLNRARRRAARERLQREDLIDPEVSGNKWRKLKKVRLLTHLTRRIRLRATPASVDA